MDEWRRRLDQIVTGGAWKLVGPVTLLIAIVSIGFGIFSVRDEIQFAREGRTATASVIRRDIDPRNDHHYVVYRFETADGRAFDGRSDVSQAKWHLIGETVEVRYLESDPTKSRAAGDPLQLVNQLAVPLVIGLIATGLGLYLLVAGLRASRRRNSEPAPAPGEIGQQSH